MSHSRPTCPGGNPIDSVPRDKSGHCLCATCKQRVLEWRKQKTATDPAWREHRNALQRRRSVQQRIYYNAKSRAKKLGIAFSIEMHDVVIPDFCPALGVPMAIAMGRSQMDFSPSLDRLIPSLGYVRGNIAVISSLANRIKNNGSVAQVRAVADWLDKALN
jgi:hypothetical protein